MWGRGAYRLLRRYFRGRSRHCWLFDVRFFIYLFILIVSSRRGKSKEAERIEPREEMEDCGGGGEDYKVEVGSEKAWGN